MKKKNYSYFALVIRTIWLQSQRRTLADLFTVLSAHTSGQPGALTGFDSVSDRADRFVESLERIKAALQRWVFKTWRHKTGAVLQRVQTGAKGLSNVVAGVLRRGLQRWFVFHRRMQFSDLQAALGQAMHISISPAPIEPVVHQPAEPPRSRPPSHAALAAEQAPASSMHSSEEPQAKIVSGKPHAEVTPDVDKNTSEQTREVKEEDVQQLCTSVLHGCLRHTLRHWTQTTSLLRTSAQMQQRLKLAEARCAKLQSELSEATAVAEARKREAQEARERHVAQLEGQKNELLQKEQQLRLELAAFGDVAAEAAELREAEAVQHRKAEELQEENARRNAEAVSFMEGLWRSQHEIDEAVELAEFLFDGLAQELEWYHSEPHGHEKKSNWSILTRSGAVVSCLGDSLRRIMLRRSFHTWLRKSAAASIASNAPVPAESKVIRDAKEDSAAQRAREELRSVRTEEAALAKAESSMAAQAKRAQGEVSQLQAEVQAAQAFMEERKAEQQAAMSLLASKTAALQDEAVSESSKTSSESSKQEVPKAEGSSSHMGDKDGKVVSGLKKDSDVATPQTSESKMSGSGRHSDLVAKQKSEAGKVAMLTEEFSKSSDDELERFGYEDLERTLEGIRNAEDDDQFENAEPELKAEQSTAPKAKQQMPKAKSEGKLGPATSPKAQTGHAKSPKPSGNISNVLKKSPPVGGAKPGQVLSPKSKLTPSKSSPKAKSPNTSPISKSSPKAESSDSRSPKAVSPAGNNAVKHPASQATQAQLLGLDMEDLASEQSETSDTSDIVLP